MPYDEINESRNQILDSISPFHVTEYDWLVQNLPFVAEADYQRRYKRYWRLNGAGLSNNYCQTYFQRLQGGLEINLGILTFDLYQIPINTNRQALQFSFCTKLCHMLNRQMPIYDSRVRLFYNFTEPLRILPLTERINGFVQFHQFLINEYNRVLNEGSLAPSIQAFRQHFTPQQFTDVKITDSLIWAYINHQNAFEQ